MLRLLNSLQVISLIASFVVIRGENRFSCATIKLSDLGKMDVYMACGIQQSSSSPPWGNPPVLIFPPLWDASFPPKLGTNSFKNCLPSRIPLWSVSQKELRCLQMSGRKKKTIKNLSSVPVPKLFPSYSPTHPAPRLSPLLSMSQTPALTGSSSSITHACILS